MLDVLSNQLDSMFANRGGSSPEPKPDQEEAGEKTEEGTGAESKVSDFETEKKEKFLAEMK